MTDTWVNIPAIYAITNPPSKWPVEIKLFTYVHEKYHPTPHWHYKSFNRNELTTASPTIRRYIETLIYNQIFPITRINSINGRKSCHHTTKIQLRWFYTIGCQFICHKHKHARSQARLHTIFCQSNIKIAWKCFSITLDDINLKVPTILWLYQCTVFFISTFRVCCLFVISLIKMPNCYVTIFDRVFYQMIANFSSVYKCCTSLEIILDTPTQREIAGPVGRANEFILMHSIDGFIVSYETIWNEISIEGSCMFLSHKSRTFSQQWSYSLLLPLIWC